MVLLFSNYLGADHGEVNEGAEQAEPNAPGLSIAERHATSSGSRFGVAPRQESFEPTFRSELAEQFVSVTRFVRRS